jgi:hypothetical protein
MVTDDRFDIGRQLSHVPTKNQIVQAMQMPGNKNRRARDVIGKMQIPFHLILFGQRRERYGNVVTIQSKPVELPFNAHEEKLFRLCRILIGVHNIAVETENKIGYSGH